MVSEHSQSIDADSFFIQSRPCPSCGHTESRPAVVADVPAEQLSPDAIGKNWRGFFNAPCFFTYHRCVACSQMFSPTYLSDQALGQLYASMGDNVHSGDEGLSYLTQESYVKNVVQRASRATRYLEIGPDTGMFSKALQKHLAVEQAYLVEPNRSVWGELSQAFTSGSSTIVPNLYELEDRVADNSLDLAVGIHVLDHMPVPGRAVDWVMRKLAPGGVAAFVVHDEGSLLARILGRRWPAYCLQHPHLYNSETLAHMLQKSGFSEVTICRTANYFPLDYLCSHGLYAVLRLKATLPIPSWPVKLKLGNIMALAVKRG